MRWSWTASATNHSMCHHFIARRQKEIRPKSAMNVWLKRKQICCSRPPYNGQIVIRNGAAFFRALSHSDFLSHSLFVFRPSFSIPTIPCQSSSFGRKFLIGRLNESESGSCGCVFFRMHTRKWKKNSMRVGQKKCDTRKGTKWNKNKNISSNKVGKNRFSVNLGECVCVER